MVLRKRRAIHGSLVGGKAVWRRWLIGLAHHIVTPMRCRSQSKKRLWWSRVVCPRGERAEVRVRLEREPPRWRSYPAISTTGLFLRKEKLACTRRRRRKGTPTELPLAEGYYAKHVWSADFKGHFRSDNGSPFSSADLGGLFGVSSCILRADTAGLLRHLVSTISACCAVCYALSYVGR